MRGRVLFLAPLSIAAVACGDYGDEWDYSQDSNEIVFGIRQRVDAATGKTEVTADYEYISLAKQGGSVPYVFRDGDGEGTCYFERYDQRLGHPRVESGVATFSGGQLPAPGLQLLANQPTPSKLEDAGWTSRDMLTFDVSGFAMPRVDAVVMRAPSTELTITGVAPAPLSTTNELSLKPTDDVGVTWTPPESEKAARVMVSLVTEEPNGPGGNVRCFGTASSGSAIIPAKWVARLFSSVDPSAPIKGSLEISSHRQITIGARDSWIVYVVATTLHREQPFTGSR